MCSSTRQFGFFLGKGFYLKQNMPKALVALGNTSESDKRKEGGNWPEKESYSIKLHACAAK